MSTPPRWPSLFPPRIYELTYRMLEHAGQMGANAVICMRYDANEIMQGVTEVLAYGTAVVVEPAA